MKLWAILFALLVACSAFVPAPAAASKAHSCCQKSKKGHSPMKKGVGCCDEGKCNPFRACTCCGFFIQQTPQLKVPALFPAAADHFFLHDEGLMPSFVGAAFHPPEC